MVPFSIPRGLSKLAPALGLYRWGCLKKAKPEKKEFPFLGESALFVYIETDFGLSMVSKKALRGHKCGRGKLSKNGLNKAVIKYPCLYEPHHRSAKSNVRCSVSERFRCSRPNDQPSSRHLIMPCRRPACLPKP